MEEKSRICQNPNDKKDTRHLFEVVSGPGQGWGDVRQEAGAGPETEVPESLVRVAGDRHLLYLPGRLGLYLNVLPQKRIHHQEQLRPVEQYLLRFVLEDNGLLGREQEAGRRVFKRRPRHVLLGASDAASHAGASRGTHPLHKHSLKWKTNLIIQV